MADYVIERTQPTIFLNRAGRAVPGFLVYVMLVEFNELHEVNVETLDPEVVAGEVGTLMAHRRALAELGQ